MKPQVQKITPIQYCDGASCTIDGASDSVAVSDPTVKTRTITGLTANTEYTFKITANKVGVSGGVWDAELDTRTRLAKPDNVAASTPTATGATITWDAVTGADTYNIRSCSGSSCTPTGDATGTAVSTNSMTITSFSSSTTYNVQVIAIGTGDEVESEWSSSVEFTTTS